MVAGRIDAMGAPADLKRQASVVVDRRAVRASGASDRRVGCVVMKALWGLLRKETYHILRDRRTLAVLIFMPIVQVILFGFSIRTDVSDVRLAIVDPSPDAATLAIRDRFNASGVFRTVAVAARAHDVEPLFKSDSAQVAIQFEPDFGAASGVGTTGADPRHDRRHRAQLGNVAPVLRQRRSPELRGRTTARRRRHPDRSAGAIAIQSDAREHEPLRARAHGDGADDHRRAHDRALDYAREGNGDDGSAARVAAAPLADHHRQGRAVSRRSVS